MADTEILGRADATRIDPGRLLGWRPGLRVKFNLVLAPLVAATILAVASLDYRHELTAVMDIHATHAALAATGAPAGPMAPATTPATIARQSLRMHAAYAAIVLLLLAIAVNGALTAFVLRPIDRIRNGIEQMERGHWRRSPHAATEDEVGRVLTRFETLGLTLDALVSQLLRAERLATVALFTKKVTVAIEPLVHEMAVHVARIHPLTDGPVRESTERIATAAAQILAALRGMDRAFDATLEESQLGAVPGRPVHSTNGDPFTSHRA